MPEDLDPSRIDGYREEIDRIDTELLKMLNRRAAYALSIGKIKKKNNMPVFVPEREQQVLAKLTTQNSGPFSEDSVRNVFQVIFAETKNLEDHLDAAQGAEAPQGGV